MGQDMGGAGDGDMFTGEYEQMSPLREQVCLKPNFSPIKWLLKPFSFVGSVFTNSQCFQNHEETNS